MARLSQAGFNLNVYLMDQFYFLHEHENPREHLNYLRDNIDKIPQDQLIIDYFWRVMDVGQMVEEYLKNHRAIGQFKAISKSIMERFGSKIEINTLENPSALKKSTAGVEIDAVFAIDAFVNTPSLIGSFKYHPFVEVGPQSPFSSVFFMLNKEALDGTYPEEVDNYVPSNIEINSLEYSFDSDFSLSLVYKEIAGESEISVVKDSKQLNLNQM